MGSQQAKKISEASGRPGSRSRRPGPGWISRAGGPSGGSLERRPRRRREGHGDCNLRRQRGAIRRRAFVVILIAVLNPLPHIAVHVMEAETIRRESVRLQTSAWGLAHCRSRDSLRFPCRYRRPSYTLHCAGPRRILPFGLRGQPVWLASHLGEPRHILLGIIPVDINHGPSNASPTLIERACSRAPADR